MIVAAGKVNLQKQLSIMLYLLLTILMALTIGMIMLRKALGHSIFNKPTWWVVLITLFLGVLPIYLLLCLFGFTGKEREEIEY